MPDDDPADWRLSGFTERRPSAETLAWVESSLGRGARVVDCRRLTGGVCSAVHRLRVDRAGTRTSVVLRQYPGDLGLDRTLEQEIAHLALVAGSDLPVPRVLAADTAGSATGGSPSIVMTMLSGRIDLDPTDPPTWLRRIAELAASLHSLDRPATAFDPGTDSWIASPDRWRVPAGATRPAVWEAAFAALAGPPPTAEQVLVHGDFLPVNLLWSRGRITGLTDWNSIHRGSRALDVGHCRRYLAALLSPQWAEELRSRYESVVGVELDPWWDLYTLMHHQDEAAGWIRRQVAGRRRPVDAAGMAARVEAVVEAALRRLG